MMLEEFAKLTGFKPDQEYYHTYIEPKYLESDMDKHEWCKQWVKKGGIQKVYNDLNEICNVLRVTKDYYFELYRKLTDDYDKLLAEKNDLIKERDESLEKLYGSKNAIDAVIKKLSYLFDQCKSEQDDLSALITKLIEVKIL